MEEIIYFKDKNVILSDSFFKYGDIKYSLNVISKTEVLFYPGSKLKLYLMLASGLTLLALSTVLVFGVYIGITFTLYGLYFLIVKKYSLVFTLSTNKTIHTLISKDLKYLKEIDDAFQLALNTHKKNHEQK